MGFSNCELRLCLTNSGFDMVQCTIAHALEKTKYPDSDIYWQKFEDKYHFSCQFTADLIAMNNADFIITSTYQEIAGTYVPSLGCANCYLYEIVVIVIHQLFSLFL